MAVKNKGLGKGLGSLLGDVADINKIKEVAPITEEDQKTEQTVKLRLVEPNRDQPRKDFDEEALKELAESIKVHGIIQPLIVTKRGEHYQIIAGERRWRAAKLAGLKEVPVIVKDYTEEEIAEISLIENIQRKDLNPIEEALAYQRLINEFNLTQEALSERISKNRTVITNAMRLLKLPEDVQEMLIRGTLSTGHAKVLLGIGDAEKQSEVAKQIIEQNLSVRETEKIVHALENPKPAKDVKKTALKNQLAYETVENTLKEKLGTKVSINRRSENSGKIEIDYYSLEDIERILAHIK